MVNSMSYPAWIKVLNFKDSGNTNLTLPIEKETISVYRDSIVNTTV
jgi:hypothetical protein